MRFNLATRMMQLHHWCVPTFTIIVRNSDWANSFKSMRFSDILLDEWVNSHLDEVSIVLKPQIPGSGWSGAVILFSIHYVAAILYHHNSANVRSRTSTLLTWNKCVWNFTFPLWTWILPRFAYLDPYRNLGTCLFFHTPSHEIRAEI